MYRISGKRYGNVSDLIVIFLRIYPIAIILMHFTLYRIASFDVTVLLAFHAVFGFTLLFRLSFDKRRLSYLIIAVIYPWLILFAEEAVFSDFIRTYALFISFFLTILTFSCLSGELICKARFYQVLSTVAMVLVMIIMLQAITGNHAFYNIFGDFSYKRRFAIEKYGRGFIGLSRANGVFLEPSVAGWVCCILLACVYALRGSVKFFRFKMLLLSLAVFCTSSASAIINMLCIYVYIFWSSNLKKAIKQFLLIPVIVVTVTAMLFNPYIKKRLYEIPEVGTSGYYRIIAPVYLLSETLTTHPLGIPLGQIEDVVSEKDYMINAGVQGTGIDNSFFVVIYYFGYIGLLSVLTFFTYAIRRIILSGSDTNAILIAMIFTLAGTGAVVCPEIAMVIVLYIWAIKVDDVKAKGSKCVQSPSLQ